MASDRNYSDVQPLIDEHLNAVYRYAYRLSGDVHDAEDLTQQVFLLAQQRMEQLREADAGPADYIAFGPVFKTSSKQKPDPLVGLDGIRAARAATKKPLVAIGGITRANARSVIDAGADSVAVIAELLSSPSKVAEEFLRMLV